MDKVVLSGRTSNQGRILVVDDQLDIVTVLCDFFLNKGYKVMGYTSGKNALASLKTQKFDLLLADVTMPEMDGIELLKAALRIDPLLAGIIMTGHGTIETAIEAKNIGVFDYVLKPFKLNELLLIVSRAIEARRYEIQKNRHLIHFNLQHQNYKCQNNCENISNDNRQGVYMRYSS